jgi:secreted Zn-dependent insulinase-like peptidase
MKRILITLAGLAAFGATVPAFAQTTNARDDVELLISQIQTDKRAIVLRTLDLTDAQVAAFTPIYDAYQAEMKVLMERGSAMLDKFAANFGSMTDEAAKDILKEAFKIRDDRNATLRKYAKKLERELPAVKVLQWVQVENKLNTLLDVEAAAAIPIAQ